MCLQTVTVATSLAVPIAAQTRMSSESEDTDSHT